MTKLFKLILIILMLCSVKESGAQQRINQNDTSVYTIVEDMPVFPGGEYKMKRFITDMIRYPESARVNNIEGTVYVSFIVEKTGSLSDIKILKGVNNDLNTEALRIISSMPYWEPGVQKGEWVRVSMVVPVEFKLTTNYNTTYRPHGDSIYYQGRYYSQEDYKKIKDEDEKTDFESVFMPGLAYSFYHPKGIDSVGQFQGLVVEYLIYAKVRPNDNPGPSHVRWYVKLNLLKSSKEDIKNLFAYSVGLDLSLEKNPKRNWMVPYFGLEFGGFSAKKLGTNVQFTPIVGLHVISRKNLFINMHGGYVYPVRDFDIYQGWFAQAGFNFALW